MIYEKKIENPIEIWSGNENWSIIYRYMILWSLEIEKLRYKNVYKTPWRNNTLVAGSGLSRLRLGEAAEKKIKAVSQSVTMQYRKNSSKLVYPLIDYFYLFIQFWEFIIPFICSCTLSFSFENIFACLTIKKNP